MADSFTVSQTLDDNSIGCVMEPNLGPLRSAVIVKKCFNEDHVALDGRLTMQTMGVQKTCGERHP